MPTRTRGTRSSTQIARQASTKAAPITPEKAPQSRGRPRKVKSEEDDEEAGSANVKKEEEDDESGLAATPKKRVKREKSEDAATPSKRSVKKEEHGDEGGKPSPGKTLAERKLALHRSSADKTPYPRWPLPTAEEADRVAWLLGRHHGYKPISEGGRGLPVFQPPAGEDKFGGCGDVNDVLEATIRTILSCNTSGTNSARAHAGLTRAFGARNWDAIANAKQEDVKESIKMGGLAQNKSKNIHNLLRETHARYGKYSLQHLHDCSDAEVLETLLSFSGVGPKVASCVLAFCLGRAAMAVDTHVFRLSLALGWVPPKANRDTTYYHLNVKVPDQLRYPLHVLLIKHGKTCPNCKAKGGGGGASKAKKESGSSGEEEDDVSTKPCPLKANGLLGRKNLKLLPEEEEEDVK